MRFRRVIVILWLGLILMTTGAVIVGRAQPMPEGLAMLHLDMCAPPCWIGITPDVTTFTSAEIRIRQVFPTSRYHIFAAGEPGDYIIQDLHDKTRAFRVHLDTDANLLVVGMEMAFDSIWIADEGVYIEGPLIRVADLNSIWGSPEGIRTPGYNGAWSPQYSLADRTEVEISPLCTDFSSIMSWSNPVETMEVFGNATSDPPPWKLWHGFLTFQRYGYDTSLIRC